MASPDSFQPGDHAPEPSGEPGASRFAPGERVRWLTYTGSVIHHRDVPYVLFDHLLDPPGGAYAVTKLERIAPVKALPAAEKGRSVLPG